MSKPSIVSKRTEKQIRDTFGKRKVCDNCRYPLQTCVCSALTRVDNKTNIIIVQDKNEVTNAKNTARLLLLSLSNISIIKSDDIESMRKLETACSADAAKFALLFPSTQSAAFETYFPSNSETQQNGKQEKGQATTSAIKHLLFIDGTWRKAKRLYLSNEWLQGIPNFHFDTPLRGQYRIRKTSIDKGLSTLEAVAYALTKTDGSNPQALYDLFEAMQSHWPNT